MSKRKQEEISEELESLRNSVSDTRDGDGAVTKRPTKRPVIEILDDEEDECSICFEPCCHPTTVNGHSCAHVFCHLCIAKWNHRFIVQGTNPTCPLCRAEITSCSTSATRSRYVKQLLKKLQRIGITPTARTNRQASRSDCIVFEVDATRAEQERLAKEGIPLTFTAMQLPPRETSQGGSSSTAIEIN